MHHRLSWVRCKSLFLYVRPILTLSIVLAYGSLSAGSVVLAASQVNAAQVAVLNDSLPGMDPATTKAIAAALRRESFEVTFLSAEEVCDPAILSAGKYFLYVITSPRCYPIAGSKALSDYLQAGGHLLVLGNPAQQAVAKYKGGWLDQAGVRKGMAEQKADCLVCDFEDVQPNGRWERFGWTGSSFNPDLSIVDLVDSAVKGSSKCAKVTFDYEENSWKSIGMTVKLSPAEATHSDNDKLLTFWAKGDAHTKRLSVRLGTGNDIRGMAVITLSEQWQRYGLCIDDFCVRGSKTDPAKATEVRFALYNSRITPLNRTGKRTFWIDKVGLATNPFASLGDLGGSPMPIIETIAPHHKRYPLKDIASVKVLTTQGIVDAAKLKFPVPASASSCYPRPEGKGFGHGYKWRWIPLAQACDADGVVRGTAAWMMLHREPLNEGPAFEAAVKCLINERDMPAALPFTGSVCAVCAASDHSALQKIAATCLIGDMVKRIRDGLFLSRAGSHSFSYWPGEAVKLGAVALNQGRNSVNVQVSVRVCAEDSGKAVFEKITEVTIKPGESATVSFDWAPAMFESQSYTVTTDLLRDGKVIDVIAHEFGVLSEQKPAADEFVTAKGRNFWLRGKKWYPVGVNYWPRYAIALECEDYTYNWLNPGFYNPEEVERDLAQMEKMGFNFVAIRAHHQTERRTLLDFLRRCKNHDIRAFLFLHTNVITDEPHYFQGIMMPTAFNEKASADVIRECRLADNPTLLGYDLIWEPAGWLFGGFSKGSFGWRGSAPYRDRWNKAWMQWVVERYGSIENAEADWGMPVPKKKGLASSPSGKQFNNDGPWRIMMAAYRRFMEDFTSREFNDTVTKLRRMDPNHLISFRQGNLSAYDFTLTPMTKHLDFFTMEGYSFNTSATGPDAVGFINRYIDYITNHKPYFWCEFGMNVWDHEEQGPSQAKISQLAEIYGLIGDIGLKTGSSGIAPWWWAGGYRISERSDYGVLKRDGTPRSNGIRLQKYAAQYKVPQEYPKSDTWFTIDRDSHAGSLRWIAFNTGAEAYRKASSANKMLGIRSDATGTTSADTPLLAVGNTPYNGKNPPKYLNAEFNRFQIRIADGPWIKVTKGAGIRVPRNRPITASVSVGNLQEATWLTPENCKGKPGAVYLASTGESQLNFTQPIAKNTAYFEDFDFGEKLLLSEGISAKTEVVLQMTAEDRAWFGEKLRFTLEPGK